MRHANRNLPALFAPILWGAFFLAASRISSAAPAAQAEEAFPRANRYDIERRAELEKRAADWRNGPIVYQVIVDRFAPPKDIGAKRALYPAPKTLHSWDETPKRGEYVKDVSVWSHEIAFWGGDLSGVRDKMDYIQKFGADVLYLNPIHKAYTNHKYDAQDYFEISPEYGTRGDLKALAAAAHERGLRLVLDGVFNHMGRSSTWFQEANSDPKSPRRDWFFFGPDYKFGYRAWANVENLPELHLENPAVQARIFGDPDSVVQGYLRDGVDGWRLDVAFDIGFEVLNRLTKSAHAACPGSLVIGEIWNYPEEWSPSVDAVINFHARQVIMAFTGGGMTGTQAGRLVARMVEDAGLDPILKAWIVLDNHDTWRLPNMLPEPWRRRMAQVLQFTIPGAPCVYYGTEAGMTGGEDPENRAPMRWDLIKDGAPETEWMRQLVKMRKNGRALRIGDFRLLDSEKLLAFQRKTDRVEELRIVVANASGEPVQEVIGLRDSKIMNYARFEDELSTQTAQAISGTLSVNVPPRTIWVLRPVIEKTSEYSPYKRVQ